MEPRRYFSITALDSNTTVFDQWIESLAGFARTQALCCDACGVTIVRPGNTEPTASQCWAAGDCCTFTKQCMGHLREYRGVFLSVDPPLRVFGGEAEE